MENNSQRLSLIQVFRGLAALLVLIHHGAKIGKDYLNYEYVGNIFSAGWIGVDFFFVLSGFIIYYIHSKDIGIKSQAKNFFLKRFIRVYPIYWIMTIALTALFIAVPSWGVGYETNTDVIIKSFILFPQTHDPIVNVGWTLVHEIFFYIIFGLLIALKPKVSFSLIAVWVAGILANSFGLLNLDNHFYLNFVFNNYNIEFLLGCFVGYITLNKNIHYNKTILMIGLIGVVLGWYGLLEETLYRYDTVSMLVFGISFSLIVVSAASIDKNSNVKVPKILLLIGDASYSIYLTHFYVFVFLFKVITKLNSMNPFNNFITITVTFFIATCLGILFHLLIEKPLIKFLNNKLLNKKRTRIISSENEQLSQ